MSDEDEATIVRPAAAPPAPASIPIEELLAAPAALPQEPAPADPHAAAGEAEESEATMVRPPPAAAAPPPSTAAAPPPLAPPLATAAPPPPARPDPPPSPTLRVFTPLERLQREPTRFSLDQAVLLLAGAATGGDLMALRLRTPARLGYPGGEVLRAELRTAEITTATFGLIGPGGVLPRHLTGTVAAEHRKHSEALHAFLDLPAARFLGLFSLAGAKYRPTRDPEPAQRILAAAIGMGTPGLEGRVSTPLPGLLFHAGHLAARSRSAERLRAMLEAETGGRVEIVEFAGGWIRLPPSEQTRLPRGRGGSPGAELGRGAALGAQVWDAQARFLIRIGPLTRREFDRLLPGTPRHRRIAELARLFAGLDTGFALNLVLAAAEVPPLSLGGTARLGWSSWSTPPKPRTKPAEEPLFEPRAA